MKFYDFNDEELCDPTDELPGFLIVTGMIILVILLEPFVEIYGLVLRAFKYF